MKAFETTVDLEIKRLLQHKNYPCLAALQSYHRKDYWLKAYENFGEHDQRPELREDLLNYLDEYKKSSSPYFTFWAVFKDVNNLDEDQFEINMWRELSSLKSIDSHQFDGNPAFSDDPSSKNFCFSIGGHAFFVVGLHPASSRLSRRFPWPALVFNTYEQFDSVSPNPMVGLYADLWESVQFSGKKNEPGWRYPFQLRGV